LSIDYQRRKAVSKAWARERLLVASGRGTRDWTPKQQKQLLKTGKVKGFQGHHMKSVDGHTSRAGDLNNIQFLDRSEHLSAHNGNFKNNTNGYFDPEKSEMKSFGRSKPSIEVKALSKPLSAKKVDKLVNNRPGIFTRMANKAGYMTVRGGLARLVGSVGTGLLGAKAGMPMGYAGVEMGPALDSFAHTYDMYCVYRDHARKIKERNIKKTVKNTGGRTLSEKAKGKNVAVSANSKTLKNLRAKKNTAPTAVRSKTLKGLRGRKAAENGAVRATAAEQPVRSQMLKALRERKAAENGAVRATAAEQPVRSQMLKALRERKTAENGAVRATAAEQPVRSQMLKELRERKAAENGAARATAAEQPVRSQMLKGLRERKAAENGAARATAAEQPVRSQTLKALRERKAAEKGAVRGEAAKQPVRSKTLQTLRTNGTKSATGGSAGNGVGNAPSGGHGFKH